MYLMDVQKEQKAKRKAEEMASAEKKFLEAKKKLKLMEEEAESCSKNAAKKAKSALEGHDFKLLAQSVALTEKSTNMNNNEIKKQRKIVDELQAQLSAV